MSQYRYHYNGPQDMGGPDREDFWGWLIAIAALVVAWPVGLFFLFRKLNGRSVPFAGLLASLFPMGRRGKGDAARSARQSTSGPFHFQSDGATGPSAGTTGQQADHVTGEKKASGEYHYRYHYQDRGTKTTHSAPQGQAAPSAGTAEDRRQAAAAERAKKLPTGKGLIISGSIVGGAFGLLLLQTFLEAFSSHTIGSTLSTLGLLAAMAGVGGVLLGSGILRRRKSRRFRKYLALIGRRESVPITTLAKAAGRSRKKVCDDLQDMLDMGIFPVGYLDLANDRLVLSAEGISDEKEAEAAPEPAPKKEDDNSILAEIREVNDQIADPVMSAKIDRIGEITGKILDYQRKYPHKAGQLRSFLNYYLPTTLKVLRAYAQLEQQGIEGENISAAKARIEGMMDKVVEGFENQLDKLFQNDAMDITTDVAVLEQMLKNDGLSSQDGLTLGG